MTFKNIMLRERSKIQRLHTHESTYRSHPDQSNPDIKMISGYRKLRRERLLNGSRVNFQGDKQCLGCGRVDWEEDNFH